MLELVVKGSRRTIGLSGKKFVRSFAERQAAVEADQFGKLVAEAAGSGAGILYIGAVAVELGSSAGGLALDSLCIVVAVEVLQSQ